MPFDYSTLEHDAKAVVLAATERIDQQNGTQAEAIIAIGKELIEVKQALKHGQFGDWLRNEFGWSPRTLSCICGSQRSLGRKAQSFRHLQPTTLHALCARSLPEVVREGVMTRLSGSEKMDDAEVRATMHAGRRMLDPPEQPPEPKAVKSAEFLLARLGNELFLEVATSTPRIFSAAVRLLRSDQEGLRAKRLDQTRLH